MALEPLWRGQLVEIDVAGSLDGYEQRSAECTGGRRDFFFGDTQKDAYAATPF